MTRPVRRLITAISLMIIITVAGTIGGFFNASDLINRVSLHREDNAYGGTTTTKAALESKVVSWTKNYDEAWTMPINDQKPYMLKEALDADGQVIQYLYYYLSDTSFEETVTYYKDVLKEKELDITVLDEFTFIETKVGLYMLSIKIEDETNQTEVVVTVDKI